MVDPKGLGQQRKASHPMQQQTDCSMLETTQQQDQTKKQRLQNTQVEAPQFDTCLQIKQPIARGHQNSSGVVSPPPAYALRRPRSAAVSGLQVNSFQNPHVQHARLKQQLQGAGTSARATADSSSFLRVPVTCGAASGMLDIGRMTVNCTCTSCVSLQGSTGMGFNPAQFEVHGMCSTRNWRKNIEVRDTGQPLGSCLDDMEPTIAAETAASRAAQEVADADAIAVGSKRKSTTKQSSRKRARQQQQQPPMSDATAATMMATATTAVDGQQDMEQGGSSGSEAAGARNSRKAKQKCVSVATLNAPEAGKPSRAAAAALGNNGIDSGRSRSRATAASGGGSGSGGSDLAEIPAGSRKLPQQDGQHPRNIVRRSQNRWEVQLHVQKQHVYVGVYPTRAEAVQARDLATLAVLGGNTGNLQPAGQYSIADIAAMQRHMAKKPIALATMRANGLWQDNKQHDKQPQNVQDTAAAFAPVAAAAAAAAQICRRQQHKSTQGKDSAPSISGKRRDEPVASSKAPPPQQQQEQEPQQQQPQEPQQPQQHPNMLYITHRDRRDNWEVQLNAPALPGSGGSRKVYVGSYPTQVEAVRVRDLAVTAVYGTLPVALQPGSSFPPSKVAAMRQQLAAKPPALELMRTHGLWPVEHGKAVQRNSAAAAAGPSNTTPAAAAGRCNTAAAAGRSEAAAAAGRSEAAEAAAATPAGRAKSDVSMLGGNDISKQSTRSAPAAFDKVAAKVPKSTASQPAAEVCATAAAAASGALASSGRVTRQQQQQPKADIWLHAALHSSTPPAVDTVHSTTQQQQQLNCQATRGQEEQLPAGSNAAGKHSAVGTTRRCSTRQQQQEEQQEQERKASQLNDRLPNICCRADSRWDVQLTSQGLRSLHIVTCNTLAEAICARDLAVLAVHGDRVPTLQAAGSYPAADVAFVRQQLAVKPAALQVMIRNGLWEAEDQAPTAVAAAAAAAAEGRGNCDESQSAAVVPAATSKQATAAGAVVGGQLSAEAAMLGQQPPRKRRRQQQQQDSPVQITGSAAQELQQRHSLPYVVHRADRNRWLVQMYPPGLGRLYIGAFANKAEAVHARDLTALALYGSSAETLQPASNYSAADVADMRQQLAAKPVAMAVMKGTGVLQGEASAGAEKAPAQAKDLQQQLAKQQQQCHDAACSDGAVATATTGRARTTAAARKQPAGGGKRQPAAAAAASAARSAVKATAALAVPHGAAAAKQHSKQTDGDILTHAAAAASRAAHEQSAGGGRQAVQQSQPQCTSSAQQQQQGQRRQQQQHQKHGLPNIRQRGKGKYDVWLRGHGVEYLRVAHCNNTADAKQQRDLAVLAVFGNVDSMPTINAAATYSAADIAVMRRRLAEQSPSAKAVMIANGFLPSKQKKKSKTAAAAAAMAAETKEHVQSPDITHLAQAAAAADEAAEDSADIAAKHAAAAALPAAARIKSVVVAAADKMPAVVPNPGLGLAEVPTSAASAAAASGAAAADLDTQTCGRKRASVKPERWQHKTVGLEPAAQNDLAAAGSLDKHVPQLQLVKSAGGAAAAGEAGTAAAAQGYGPAGPAVVTADGGADNLRQHMQQQQLSQQRLQQKRATAAVGLDRAHRLQRRHSRVEQAQPRTTEQLQQQQPAQTTQEHFMLRQDGTEQLQQPVAQQEKEQAEYEQQQQEQEPKQQPRSLPNISHRMDRGKWEVFLHAGKGSKSVYVGSFSSQSQAVRVRDLAVLAMHGGKAATLEPASSYEAGDVHAMRQQLAGKPASRAALIANGMWPAGGHKRRQQQQEQQQAEKQQQQEVCLPSRTIAAAVPAPSAEGVAAAPSSFFTNSGGHLAEQAGAKQLPLFLRQQQQQNHQLPEANTAHEPVPTPLAATAAAGGGGSVEAPYVISQQQRWQQWATQQHNWETAAAQAALQPVVFTGESPAVQDMDAGAVSASDRRAAAADLATGDTAPLAALPILAPKQASASVCKGLVGMSQPAALQAQQAKQEINDSVEVTSHTSVLPCGAAAGRQAVADAAAAAAANDALVVAAAPAGELTSVTGQLQDNFAADSAAMQAITQHMEQQIEQQQQRAQQALCGDQAYVSSAEVHQTLCATQVAAAAAAVQEVAKEGQLASTAVADAAAAAAAVTKVSKPEQLPSAAGAALPAATVVKHEREWVEEVESGDLMELDELDMLL